MSTKKILVTGGAGFIGTHLSRRLLERGHEVSVLDNFSPQVHGANQDLAMDLRAHVEVTRGDVRDLRAWEQVLKGHDVVVHLAAETGTGQSMYQVRHYTEVNIGGTATMLECIVNKKIPVETLIVASSRAIYGEGAYICAEHGIVYPAARRTRQMQQGCFEPECPICAATVSPTPTTEDALLRPSSIYGLTKQVQEQMVLMYAATLGIKGFAMRYQNVYGPGQSLKNPYTGILAIFSNQARVNEPIYIFEDGKESRDFVYIADVVDATVRAAESEKRSPMALNVGSGVPVTVLQVVSAIIEFFGSSSQATVNGAFREGDIRHNFADLTRVRRELGFEPSWNFTSGLKEFLNWARSQEPAARKYEQSLDELRERGLMHG